MGAGIAQVFAALGSTVVIAEAADQEAALGRVSTGLDRAHERGKLTESPADILARVTTVAGPADLPADLVLVVEEVPEIPPLMVEVLALIVSVHLGAMMAATIVVFAVLEGGDKGFRPLDLARTFVGKLVANPLIIGIVAGLAWRMTGWPLPSLAARFVAQDSVHED